MTFIVATTSLPVNRLNADRLERRTLVPMMFKVATNVVAMPIWTMKIPESLLVTLTTYLHDVFSS